MQNRPNQIVGSIPCPGVTEKMFNAYIYNRQQKDWHTPTGQAKIAFQKTQAALESTYQAIYSLISKPKTTTESLSNKLQNNISDDEKYKTDVCKDLNAKIKSTFNEHIKFEQDRLILLKESPTNAEKINSVLKTQVQCWNTLLVQLNDAAITEFQNGKHLGETIYGVMSYIVNVLLEETDKDFKAVLMELRDEEYDKARQLESRIEKAWVDKDKNIFNPDINNIPKLKISYETHLKNAALLGLGRAQKAAMTICFNHLTVYDKSITAKLLNSDNYDVIDAELPPAFQPGFFYFQYLSLMIFKPNENAPTTQQEIKEFFYKMKKESENQFLEAHKKTCRNSSENNHWFSGFVIVEEDNSTKTTPSGSPSELVNEAKNSTDKPTTDETATYNDTSNVETEKVKKDKTSIENEVDKEKGPTKNNSQMGKVSQFTVIQDNKHKEPSKLAPESENLDSGNTNKKHKKAK